jgi:hypothetical protein
MNQHPEFWIDTLNITLPPGFEHRAEAIARETARQLARMPVLRSNQMANLSLPAIRVGGGEANGVIARRIAGAIHRRAMIGAQQGVNDAD